MQINYKNVLAGVGIIAVILIFSSLGLVNFAYLPNTDDFTAEIQVLNEAEKGAESLVACDSSEYNLEKLTTVCGRVIIEVQNIPESPQVFAFSGSLLGNKPFSLVDNGYSSDQNKISIDVARKINKGEIFTVTQESNLNYSTVVSCSDPSGGSFIKGNSANIALNPAKFETIHCIFTNTKI